MLYADNLLPRRYGYRKLTGTLQEDGTTKMQRLSSEDGKVWHVYDEWTESGPHPILVAYETPVGRAKVLSERFPQEAIDEMWAEYFEACLPRSLLKEYEAKT